MYSSHCFSPFQFSAQQRNRPFSSDQTAGSNHFLQLISRLTDETIIYVIRPTDQTILLLSDHQTRQCSYYMYQTTRTDNSPVIRPPNKTIFLSTFYHTGAFSSERQSTSLDHLFWPTAWPDHLPSQLNRSATDLRRTPIHPPDLHPGQDISSWVGSYGGLIYIYRILNEPCKVYVYFPHTFSGKTLDFLLRLVFCFVLF